MNPINASAWRNAAFDIPSGVMRGVQNRWSLVDWASHAFGHVARKSVQAPHQMRDAERSTHMLGRALGEHASVLEAARSGASAAQNSDAFRELSHTLRLAARDPGSSFPAQAEAAARRVAQGLDNGVAPEDLHTDLEALAHHMAAARSIVGEDSRTMAERFF